MSHHHPTDITLHTASRALEVSFDDGVTHTLPCEYLRVFSPSAEVRGHGLPEPLLVSGKRAVNISAIEPVGQYAVKLVFDDGHDSGLYDWDFLYALGQNQAPNWARYLARLEAAGKTRDA
ncbi:MAG: DUF971 domain-containing protein [Halothiobacillaceae bacterium]|nr:MAG: DUF971 domain-containing protein [Halothiobacillaceae bacterium]